MHIRNLQTNREEYGQNKISLLYSEYSEGRSEVEKILAHISQTFLLPRLGGFSNSKPTESFIPIMVTAVLLIIFKGK